MDVFRHLPYSLDLAPSDFAHFPALKVALGGKKFSNDEGAKTFTQNYFPNLGSLFYQLSIQKLISRYSKCLSLFSNYVENCCSPAASGTKSLLVADCMEKLTVLSEIKQVAIMWVPGDSGIQQNETADRLAREEARTRPIGPEPFIPLSLSRFKSKIRDWIEKRKQTEWKVCEKYWTSQLCLEGPTDRYVQFISKLDRKHCRMLIGLLTGHINL